jgi:hypothetical protein
MSTKKYSFRVLNADGSIRLKPGRKPKSKPDTLKQQSEPIIAVAPATAVLRGGKDTGCLEPATDTMQAVLARLICERGILLWRLASVETLLHAYDAMPPALAQDPSAS